MLATLSGCQKELMAPNNLNPISRLEAEQLLKEWNADRKSTLKSAAIITLSEKQWQGSKVYMNERTGLSFISVPLSSRLAICFARDTTHSEICFCETRPDNSYLTKTNGKVYSKTFCGYLIFYNEKGKGIVARRYENGQLEGEYEVVPKRSLLKNIAKDMQYTQEVEVTATRRHQEATFFILQGEDPIGTPPGVDPRYETVLIGNDDSPSTYPTPEPKIDDEKLKENLCAKLAWDLLRNNYTFNGVINKFIGSNSVVNISFEVIPNLMSGNKKCDAKTSELLGDTYIISIDSGFASHSNTMEVARALLHEVVHADLNYYYDLCHRNPSEFQKCYPDMYTRWQAYGFENIGTFQHGEMTDYYRTTMKDILKNIYPGLSDSMYDAATWGGLMSTSAWNALPQSEKDSIINTIKDLRNSSNGNCSQ